jgi:hypothetical protein
LTRQQVSEQWLGTAAECTVFLLICLVLRGMFRRPYGSPRILGPRVELPQLCQILCSRVGLCALNRLRKMIHSHTCPDPLHATYTVERSTSRYILVTTLVSHVRIQSCLAMKKGPLPLTISQSKHWGVCDFKTKQGPLFSYRSRRPTPTTL